MPASPSNPARSAPVPLPASPAGGARAVGEPVGGTPGVCQACGKTGPTHYVEFQQNIGLVVLRLHRAVKGRLCAPCVRQQFGSMTTVTLIAGWWGVISFFLTPIILIGNVVQYLGARKAFRAGPAGSGPVVPAPSFSAPAVAAPAVPREAGPSATASRPRQGLAIASLALGVSGILCMGVGGVVPLVAIVLGFVALSRVARNPGQYGGRGLALGGIATGGAGLALALVFWGLLLLGSAKRTPVQTAFDEASRRIDTYADAEAFGNTEEARAMAERFSRVLKAVDKLAFTGPRDTGLSLSQGRFLTYVELRQDSVCFLVHVPQLRAYDGDVRRSLLDLAWTTAREASRDVRKDRDLRLGVGLRGAVAYGAVAAGMGEGKPTQELGSVVSTTPLEAFFTGPARRTAPRLTAATAPEAAR
jgi:hypothetical protein